MEILSIVLLVGAVYLLVGAVRGHLAAARTHVLERQIDTLRGQLRELQRRVGHPETGEEDRPDRAWFENPTPARAASATPTGAAVAAEAVAPLGLATGPGFAGDEAAGPVESEPAREREADVVGADASTSPVPEVVDPSATAASAPSGPPEGRTRAEGAHAPAAEPVLVAAGEPARAPAAAREPTAFAGVEQALGLRWLTWIGIGLLFLGVAFFLKYAYDRDWLGRFFGPRLRIATAAAAAATLVVLGWRSLRNGMQALGQGLLGGGQGLAYLTIFAAHQPAIFVVDEPLIGPVATFALMMAVTAAGLVLAVRLDAVATAFLAVLGGFATPALIHTGADSRDVLCLYLLLLDLGVLAVAAHRRWRALDLLAFVGTCVLFAGWWLAHGDAHPQPDATLAWVAVFHFVFAVLPYVQHWRNGTPVELERFVLALANLAATLLFLGSTLRTTAPGVLAASCLLGAPFYFALGLVTARRVGSDARTRDGFLALGVFLVTLGVFYLLPGERIATAWFAESVVLTWLGFRFTHVRSRQWALVLFAIALVRTGLRFRELVDPLAPLLLHGRFASLAIAGCAGAAVAWLHRLHATSETERLLARGLGISTGFWFLGILANEIARHASVHPESWQTVRPVVAIAWLLTIGSLLFLAWARRDRSIAALVAGLFPLFGAGIAAGMAYSGYPADAWPVLNGACVAGLGAAFALLPFAHSVERLGGSAELRPSLLGALQLALTVLATVETAAWLQRGTAAPTTTSMAEALGWVWLGIGMAGVVHGSVLASRRVLGIALLPIAAAACVPFLLYGNRQLPHVLVANSRYLFAMATCAALAGARAPLRRHAGAVADFASAVAFVMALLWSAFEAATWSDTNFDGTRTVGWIVWLLGLVAVLGTIGGAWRARATENPMLRATALGVLFGAVPLPLAVYAADFPVEWMFANARFALVAASVAASVLWSRLDERFAVLRKVALGIALLGLTFEPPTWFYEHVADAAEAVRLAKFSVTVTWMLSGIALLITGFRFDRRGLRLTALGLFALTAGKLLAFDMSGAQQLYRILAFVLVGIVFVGASWLYHRVEKRLLAKRTPPE